MSTPSDHRRPPGGLPARHVLVAIDGDRELQALHVAARLAERLGAEITVVGVAPVVPPPMLPLEGLGPPLAAYDSAQQDLAERLAEERLEEAAATLPAGVAHETVLVWGPPGAAIVSAAAEHHAELIVVPMRKGGHLGHLLHDHADLHVLHHADVPVLVVPTEG